MTQQRAQQRDEEVAPRAFREDNIGWRDQNAKQAQPGNIGWRDQNADTQAQQGNIGWRDQNASDRSSY